MKMKKKTRRESLLIITHYTLRITRFECKPPLNLPSPLLNPVRFFDFPIQCALWYPAHHFLTLFTLFPMCDFPPWTYRLFDFFDLSNKRKASALPSVSGWSTPRIR